MKLVSYSIQVPETQDNGSVVADAIDASLTQLAGHSHNGVDSALLALGAVVTQTSSITTSDSGWNLVSTGVWNLPVSMPSGLEFWKTPPRFFTSDGKEVHLSVQRTAASSFQIFAYEKLNLTVVYR